MNYKETLNDEIQNELETLSGMQDLGTDTYKTLVDGITKLIDKSIELHKLETGALEKENERRLDNELKVEQIKLDNELRVEQIKLDNELKAEQARLTQDFNQHQSEVENSLKREQIENEKKDAKFRNGIAIGSLILSTALAVWGTNKTLKFEETGTVTTIMGKGFINSLIPRKK